MGRMTERERAIRQRLKDDFPHYAERCLHIRTKAKQIRRLALNTAQLYLHTCLEEQRRTRGMVRALILKGRQQGCSTYTEARYFHKVTHQEGVRAFILTHHDDATRNLFDMTKRFYDNCPLAVRPATRRNNGRELDFSGLDSSYRIATAGTRGAGRSDTIQYFHGSEVAFWPNAEGHMSGAMQAVPLLPGTEVILESTSNGPQGVFFDMCMEAQQGVGDYQLVFIPWFWQEEYRKDATDFEPDDDDLDYAERHGLDLEQLAWRRSKTFELRSAVKFRMEYPADVSEAFRADAEGALWKRSRIADLRVLEYPPLVRVVVAIDPAVTNNPKSDETGIVVAGLGTDGHGYVLADRSMKGEPHDWAQAAVAAYQEFKADAIIGETNNGGLMVRDTIRAVSRKAHYIGVSASRGKVTRAEPVAALYGQETGMVHHVGTHAGLEDQMCTWVPATGESPDRIDALVWALTALLLQESYGFIADTI